MPVAYLDEEDKKEAKKLLAAPAKSSQVLTRQEYNVAPPAEKPSVGWVSRKYQTIKPEYMDDATYKRLFENTLNQSPLKQMGIESAKLDELLKKQQEYKESPMPTALSAAARMFSDLGGVPSQVIDRIEEFATRRERKPLEDIKAALGISKEKAALAKDMGDMALRGLASQVVKPDTLMVGQSEFDPSGKVSGLNLDRRMSEYANKIQSSGIIDSMAAIDRLKNEIPDLFDKRKIDDPVEGYRNEGLIGQSAQAKYFKNIGLSEEAKKNRAAIAGVIDGLRHGLYGAALTEKEAGYWERRIGDATLSGNGSLIRRELIAFDNAIRTKRANLDQGYSDVAPLYYEQFEKPKFKIEGELGADYPKVAPTSPIPASSYVSGGGGLSPEKKARLEELRRKKAEGTLK